MKKLYYLIALLVLLGCKKDDEVPVTSFTRIYDHSNYNVDYRPLDVEEGTDSYVILATTTLDRTQFPGIQLVQVDKEGEFESSYEFSENTIAPTSDLMKIDTFFYFFAMDPVSLQASLVSFTPGFGNITATPLNGLLYPLAGSLTSDNQFLLLSYNPDDKLSVISKVDRTGSVGSTAAYTIGPGSDVEEAIINHYTQPDDKSLSFFCGEVSGSLVYFNGFFNYSMSLVFSNFSGDPAGVVQGQFTDAGIRSVLPINGSTFAISGYQFDDNYIYPSVTLSTGGLSSSVDLYTSNAAEWRPHTPVVLKNYMLNEVQYIIYAAETKSRQIALYMYEKNSGNFAGLTHIGYANPFTLSSLTVDEENHLVVLGTTYVAGRFRRIFVEKISETDMEKRVLKTEE
ncbi:hypothetical protein [uncultured Imperialibacter sp.]|uniref:hypothetical protein n=1 Tax=uncultured Imperialibacter sp. TaxID=1672639 RepID=UPI0030D98F96|tara:strand:+ start:17756 stop:18949 length:1194 start_codon:yes stop_codon:yes gene_type:complete